MNKAKRSRPITTQPDKRNTNIPNIKIGGWYQGRQTYLWFGDSDDRCVGTLSGRNLYRLAKAIVTRFEGA